MNQSISQKQNHKSGKGKTSGEGDKTRDEGDKTSGKGKDSHHLDLENIYEDLRGMAGEFALPVFTASQAGRTAADSEIVTGEQVAGAYAKIMIGDFVISLSRKVTDKISGTGRFYIIKKIMKRFTMRLKIFFLINV